MHSVRGQLETLAGGAESGLCREMEAEVRRVGLLQVVPGLSGLALAGEGLGTVTLI